MVQKAAPAGERAGGLVWPVLAVLAAASFLLLYYASYHRFGYLSAPGGDLYNHYLWLQRLQHGEALGGYPRLFHAAVWGVMAATGLPYLKAVLYMVPITMLAAAGATAYLAYSLAGERAARPAGLIALILMLFVAYQPWQTLYDGGFPDVIATGVWIPLAIAWLVGYERTGRRAYLAASAVAALCVLATHHFSVAGLAVAALAAAAYYRNFFLVGRRLAITLAAAAFLLLLAGRPFFRILSLVLRPEASFPWIRLVGKLNDSNSIWPCFGDYPAGLGPLIFYAGLAGLAWMLVRAFRRATPAHLALGSLVLASWGIALLVGSQIEALGFPVRLARDAGIPLAAAASVALCSFAVAPTFPVTLRCTAVLCAVVWVVPQLQDRYWRIAGRYEPTIQYTQADQAAVDRVAGAPAVSLNRPLPSIGHPNVTFGQVTLPAADAATEGYNERAVAGRRYALYELGAPEENGRYADWLAAHGFREVARFTDPLKTVILTSR